MSDAIPHAFRVKELARRWRTRTQNIRAMIRRGELAAFAINGQARIAPEAVAAAERALAIRPAPKRRTREVIPREVAELLNE